MTQLLKILSAATLALAVGCASSSKPSLNESRSSVHLSAGVDALERRDYTMALRSLLEAAKFAPKSAEVWSNIGVAYIGKDEVVRAEESWKKALVFDPTHNDARLNLGILYSRLKRYPEAERQFKEVLKDLTYAQQHQAAYRLGLMYLELHRPLLAEQQFKLAVKANTTYCPAWLQLGLIQKERGDYAEAAQSLRGSVMGTCYKNPQAHYEIASLYLKARDIPQAKSKLLEVIQLFPSSEWAKKSEATLNMIR